MVWGILEEVTGHGRIHRKVLRLLDSRCRRIIYQLSALEEVAKGWLGIMGTHGKLPFTQYPKFMPHAVIAWKFPWTSLF